MQELAEKVVEVVTPLRDKLDAVLIFPSMPDVMRLNKVRSFTCVCVRVCLRAVCLCRTPCSSFPSMPDVMHLSKVSEAFFSEQHRRNPERTPEL